MMHGTHVTLTHCNMMHGTHVTLIHCNMMHGTHNVKLKKKVSCCPNKDCGLLHEAVTRGKIVTSRSASSEFHWRTFRHCASSFVAFYTSPRNGTYLFYLLTDSSPNSFLFLFLSMLFAITNKI